MKNANINTGHYSNENVNGGQTSIGWYYSGEFLTKVNGIDVSWNGIDEKKNIFKDYDAKSKSVPGMDTDSRSEYLPGDRHVPPGEEGYPGYYYEFIKIPKNGWIEFVITSQVTASQAEWSSLDHDSDAFQEIYKNSQLRDKPYGNVGEMYNYSYNPQKENLCESVPVTTSSIWCTYIPYEKKSRPGASDWEIHNEKGEVTGQLNLANNITTSAEGSDKNGRIYKETEGEEKGQLKRPDGQKNLMKYSDGSLIKYSATSSRDVFVVKQYNVEINTFIKDVERANGNNTANGEYLVDNGNYSPGGNRKNISESERKRNPVYVENGDVITIRVILKNNSDSSSAYFWKTKALQKVKVPFDISIDDGYYVQSVELFSVEGTEDREKPVDLNEIKPGKTVKELVIKNVPNKSVIKVDVKIKINPDPNKAVGWRTDSNGRDKPRSISSKICYKKSELGLPTGVHIVNYFGYKQCYNTAWWDDYDTIKAYRGSKFNVEKWDEEYYNYDGDSLLKTKTADYFQVKSYNVALDQYIQKVEHQETRGAISGITSKETYNSEARRSNSVDNLTQWDKEKNGSKANNPVSVEYGDIVTYQIKIYNTNERATTLNSVPSNQYNIGPRTSRTDAPYKKPREIKVDINNVFSSPNYTVLSVKNSGGIDIANTKREDGKTLSLTNVAVGAGSVETITIQICVEDKMRNTIVANATQIVKVVNVNDFVIDNKSKTNVRKANDYYKLNDYKVDLSQYISVYNAEMAKYNNTHGFTIGEAEGLLYPVGTQYTAATPLFTEKYETLTTTTIVQNTASGGENEINTNNSPAKYNTRARPTEVTITVPSSLSIMNTSIVWYRSNGTTRALIKDVDYTYDAATGKYTIINDEIILLPGEYLAYVLNLQVIESNFYLGDIQVTSSINKLTNINKNWTNERDVTDQNISTYLSDFDVLKLKELVIAGNVWLDESRNGKKDETTGKNNVVVTLYRKSVNQNDYTLVTKVRQTETGTVTEAVTGKFYRKRRWLIYFW